MGLPAANEMTKRAFDKHVDALRKVHNVKTRQVYRYMEPCCCSECDGFGSGQASTLHTLEKEIAGAVNSIREQAGGQIPDFTDLRAFCLHPLNFLQSQLNDLWEEGFCDENDENAMLAKIVSEHADIVKTAIQGGTDEDKLREGEELASILSDWNGQLRAKIRVKQRMGEIDRRPRWANARRAR